LSPHVWPAAPPPPLLTCAEVTGGTAIISAAIYSVDLSGPLCRVTNPGLLTTAVTDMTNAFTDAANRTPFTTLSAADNQLGGQTLTAGVYRFGGATTANLTAANPLTLDALGDPNAVFIFQATSSLVTASGSVVRLVNGAQACNVYWQVVSQATLGTGSTFPGTIMAGTAIVDDGGSTVNGRFLAQSAVTLNNTTITRALCSPTIATTLSVPSVVTDSPVQDSATLTGATSTAGGTGGLFCIH